MMKSSRNSATRAKKAISQTKKTMQPELAAAQPEVLVATDATVLVAADTIAELADGRERAKTHKQAVVIVHGMGEQKPLETLRGFVQAVWGSNLTPSEPTPQDIWLVPDMRAGLKELARVTTRKNQDGTRTDFYELYWSDLMVGNTLSQLRAWLTGLLLRWPHQVPKETFSTWLLLWGLVGVLAAIAIFVGLDNPINDLRALWDEAEVAKNWWSLGASAFLGVVLCYAMGSLLWDSLRDWTNANKVYRGTWATQTPKQASKSVWWSRGLVAVLPIIVAWLAYNYFAWEILLGLKAWGLILAGLIVFAAGRWVVPIFGDVARYVRTSPDAVASRSEIRERGLQLMRQLHGQRAEASAQRYDFGDRGDYDRIVVVGHSLGSIVAYDVLRLFWEEFGPTKNNPPPKPVADAMGAIDTLLRDCLTPDKPNGKRIEAELDELRGLQDDLQERMEAAKSAWRITDFVTLGSPLTHAEFLVSRDRAAFEERKAERMFPTCPPMMEGGTNSFLYQATGDGSAKFAHHAAIFSAVRWTNIYDPATAIFYGDFIGGPCAPNFGPAVVDVPIAINKGGLFPRLVTHTHYWNVNAISKMDNATVTRSEFAQLAGEPQVHLAVLKAALRLGEPQSQTKLDEEMKLAMT